MFTFPALTNRLCVSIFFFYSYLFTIRACVMVLICAPVLCPHNVVGILSARLVCYFLFFTVSLRSTGLGAQNVPRDHLIFFTAVAAAAVCTAWELNVVQLLRNWIEIYHLFRM